METNTSPSSLGGTDLEEAKGVMRDIGHIIGDAMPKDYGFCLMVFKYGAPGDTFYISKAKRSDMLQMMREFIRHQEEAGY